MVVDDVVVVVTAQDRTRHIICIPLVRVPLTMVMVMMAETLFQVSDVTSNNSDEVFSLKGFFKSNFKLNMWIAYLYYALLVDQIR